MNATATMARLACLCILAHCVVLQARLARAEETQGCVGKATLESSLDACNKAISSRQFTGPALARMFQDRAWVRMQIADVDDSLGVPDAKKKAAKLALPDLDQAIALQPAYYGNYTSRCQLRSELGSKEAALADCGRAISLSASAEPKFQSMAWYTRGQVHRRASSSEAAIANYTKALTVYGGHFFALYARGCVREQSGDKSGGGADIAAAIALSPALSSAPRCEWY